MTDAAEVARNIVFDKTTEPNLISYSIRNHANGDEWAEIKIVFNGSSEPVQVKVPRADWTVIAADGELSASGLGTSRGGKLQVAPVSALILAR